MFIDHALGLMDYRVYVKLDDVRPDTTPKRRSAFDNRNGEWCFAILVQKEHLLFKIRTHSIDRQNVDQLIAAGFYHPKKRDGGYNERELNWEARSAADAKRAIELVSWE